MKKIKDLTIGEVLKYCRNTKCKDCIFNTYCGEEDLDVDCEIKLTTIHSDDFFEQEIEVDKE